MTLSTDPRIAVPLDEAAHLVGMSKDVVYRAIRAGDLPARKNGTKFSIRIDDLDEWQRNLPLA